VFDGNRYRKEVLRPLLDSGDRTFDDVFAIFSVDVDESDESRIQVRIEEVVGFWRKEQSSPRYKSLVSALLKQRAELSAVLLDPAQLLEREQRRELRAVAARAAGEQHRIRERDAGEIGGEVDGRAHARASQPSVAESKTGPCVQV